MKTSLIIVAFLSTAMLSQNAPSLGVDRNNDTLDLKQDSKFQKDTNKFIDDFTGDVNQRIQDEHRKEEQALLDEFFAKQEDAIESAMEATYPVQVGRFVLLVHSNCNYLIPPPPELPEPPLEDCIRGEMDANYLAKAIASVEPQSPKSVEGVLHLLGECRVIGESTVTVKITPYGSCLEEGFADLYALHFEKLKSRMAGQGFIYDEDTESFVRKTQTDIVELDNLDSETRTESLGK